MKTDIGKSKKNSSVKFGYLIAFILLLLSYVLTLFANRQLMKRGEMVDHTNKVLGHLELILSNVKDAETGFRGYLASKDQVYLASYYSSRQQVDSVYKLLKKETADNNYQQQRLATVYKLINSKFQHIQSGMQLFAKQAYEMSDSLLRDLLVGKQVMDSIRYALMGMRMEERGLVKERGENVDATAKALSIITIVSLVIAFLMLAFGLITYTKENRARRQADRKVQGSQQQLELRIEELNKANKELLQMRSVEKFTASGRIARTIAHEIRNPLTNINLALEQLRNDWPGMNEDINVFFDMMERNSSRINQLISELLASTKFAELNYNKVSVNELLDGALDMAKDRVLLKNITVEKRYSNNIGEVSADKEKMKIAFLNLIVNAIEAMEPEKGKLLVKTKAENNKCVIEIIDNGSGIDKDSMAKLFEPYFTNKPKGNGLGLTNTQNIILNHKGTISVESEEGRGTRFRIELDFAS